MLSICQYPRSIANDRPRVRNDDLIEKSFPDYLTSLASWAPFNGDLMAATSNHPNRFVASNLSTNHKPAC